HVPLGSAGSGGVLILRPSHAQPRTTPAVAAGAEKPGFTPAVGAGHQQLGSPAADAMNDGSGGRTGSPSGTPPAPRASGSAATGGHDGAGQPATASGGIRGAQAGPQHDPPLGGGDDD